MLIIQGFHGFFFYQLTCIQYFNFFLQTLLFYYRSESESEAEEVIPLLSEEDMNKLGAKLVKAEIMGNTVRLSSMCIITCINKLVPLSLKMQYSITAVFSNM